MSTPGSALQTKVLKYLEGKGVFCWRNNTMGTFDPKLNNGYGSYRSFNGMKGAPDIIAITHPTKKHCGGVFVGIEIKAKGDRMSAHQKLFAKRCAYVNAEYLVVRKFEDVKQLDYLWK